jgi:DNA-binding transcriptional ArsR family regulator
MTMSKPKNIVFRGRDAVMADAGLSAGARLLYYHLDYFAYDKGETFVSQQTLGLVGCGTDKTIDERTKELEAAGYIRVQRRRGRSNVYSLDEDSAYLTLDELRENPRREPGPITPF